jgi:hypothetical protein
VKRNISCNQDTIERSQIEPLIVYHVAVPRPRCEIVHTDGWIGGSPDVEQENIIELDVVLAQN